MPPPKRTSADSGTGARRKKRLGGCNSVSQFTAAAVETLVFADAERSWLDHLLGGDIPSVEGVHAARVLVDRAERFALVPA
jgi:hypothetical protein